MSAITLLQNVKKSQSVPTVSIKLRLDIAGRRGKLLGSPKVRRESAGSSASMCVCVWGGV